MRIATIWVQYLVITLLLVLEIGGAVRADSKKYRMAVTDITGMEELQREFKDFQAAIQEHSTLDVKLFPVTSRTAVVESLRKGRLDFALTGPVLFC